MPFRSNFQFIAGNWTKGMFFTFSPLQFILFHFVSEFNLNQLKSHVIENQITSRRSFVDIIAYFVSGGADKIFFHLAMTTFTIHWFSVFIVVGKGRLMKNGRNKAKESFSVPYLLYFCSVLISYRASWLERCCFVIIKSRWITIHPETSFIGFIFLRIFVVVIFFILFPDK